MNTYFFKDSAYYRLHTSLPTWVSPCPLLGTYLCIRYMRYAAVQYSARYPNLPRHSDYVESVRPTYPVIPVIWRLPPLRTSLTYMDHTHHEITTLIPTASRNCGHGQHNRNAVVRTSKAYSHQETNASMGSACQIMGR